MPPASRSLAFCLAFGVAPLCQAEWFTLNDASDLPDEMVQVDPTSVTANGQTRTVRVRVTRSTSRRAANGSIFRSFEGTVSIDCISRSARYDSYTFYARPNFEGAPVYTQRFGPDEARPAALGTLRRDFAERVIRAACSVKPSESNAGS